MVDHFPDVPRQALGLARPSEHEELRQDSVEPAGLFAESPERAGALLLGQALLLAEQRRRVDDGRQGVADLVGYPRRQLARRRQPLGFAQSRVEALTLGDVGHQLEQEDLTVRLSHGRAAQREATIAAARHLEARRIGHLVAAIERAGRALDAVGADDLVATPARDLAELLVHPAV